jgi:two-component system C4-dicarboxylate transport response regulator DctD
MAGMRADHTAARHPAPSVLVVNQDPVARNRIVAVLAAAHFDVSACASAAEALALLRIARRNAMVVDASLEGGTSVELLHACVAAGVAPATIMTTARGEIETAVEAMREGFSDYVAEPFDDRLTQALLSALSSAPSAIPSPARRA